MKRAASLIVVLLAAHAAHAETIVRSKIVSVGLFKNGLAVVKQLAIVDGNGEYRLEDVPTPVHGTFWVESDAQVSTRITSREIDVPIKPTNVGDFQRELVGRSVNIHFRDGRLAPVAGKVVRIAQSQGDDAWNRNYSNGYSRNNGRRAAPRQFMVLQTKSGHSYVNSSLIAYVQVTGSNQNTVKKRVPVLIMKVREAKKKARLLITYLAKGMAWAPSYRIDITDPKQLTIEQKAVIKNELTRIDGANIYLISGFPGVKFANVVSPLSHQTTWSNFFSQLNRRPSQNAYLGNVVSQQAIAYNSAPTSAGQQIDAKPSGEGVDLHYQSIGTQKLAEGDALAVSVGRSRAPYDRIVDWVIPDTRGAYGQYIQPYQRRQSPGKFQDSAWDAIQFKNPLPFPMTTGAAMIVSHGRFNGQNVSFFVNKGEQTTLRITKALSIRTSHVEHEEKERNRRTVYVGGRRFREVRVKGELTVSNHRRESIKMCIRRRFSGELLEASGNPASRLLESGVYSTNKRNELDWKVLLRSGERRRLTYRYLLLVSY